MAVESDAPIQSLRCIPPDYLRLRALEGARVLIRRQSIETFRVIFCADQKKAATVVFNSGGPLPPLSISWYRVV